jgi:hypothetical protein
LKDAFAPRFAVLRRSPDSRTSATSPSPPFLDDRPALKPSRPAKSSEKREKIGAYLFILPQFVAASRRFIPRVRIFPQFFNIFAAVALRSVARRQKIRQFLKNRVAPLEN